MTASQPEISAIVIVYNGALFLKDCLTTLSEDLREFSHEIIAVDNGSSDGSIAFIKSHFPGATMIENGANLGFARAVNIGIERSRGLYCYLLNQDLRFRPGTMRSLLSRLQRDPQIGLIGPKFVDFSGALQRSVHGFPSHRHVIYSALLLPKLFPRHREFASWQMGWFDHETEMTVDQPMGSVMLIPREVIRRVGLFDEQFPIFFNDVDYCRRIRDFDYYLLYYPKAIVEHHVGGSTGRHPYRMKIESHLSMFRYLKKYARRREYPLLLICGVLLMLGLIPSFAIIAFRRTRSA